jgi:hypothetical protein
MIASISLLIVLTAVEVWLASCSSNGQKPAAARLPGTPQSQTTDHIQGAASSEQAQTAYPGETRDSSSLSGKEFSGVGQGDTELGYLSGWRKEDMSDYNGRMMMRGRVA